MHRSRCALCLLLVLAALLSGCGQPAVPVTKIKCRLIPGIFADQLAFTNEESEPLSRVDLKITVRTEGRVVDVPRHWGMWATNEEKIVELPVGIGTVEEVIVRGTGTFDTSRKPARFDTSWIMVHTPNPGK
jgi:hypothetical protein